MKNLKPFLFLLVLLAGACQSNGPSKQTDSDASSENVEIPIEENPEVSTDHSATDSKPFREKDQVYAWVDRLHIRDQASVKGKSLTAVDSEEVLELTGTKSEDQATIVLRGGAYQDHWYEVRTPDGTVGWVFGGAVKRAGEAKGTNPIQAQVIDFPYFRQYDLSKWKKVKSETLDGEMDGSVHTYRKGNQLLEVTQSERGEFGYSFSQKLMTADQKTIKERELRFIPSDMPDQRHEITETVKDYSKNPSQQYSKVQQLDVHYSQLNARPVIALGSWQTQSIDAPISAAGSSGKMMIQPIDYQQCTIIRDQDSGCSCNFRAEKQIKSENIFLSDMEKNGCIQLNGKTYQLSGGFIGDTYQKLISQSENEYWIALNEGGTDYLFGEKMDINDAWSIENTLFQTLLVMPKLPDQIPLQMNGTVGMGHRGNVQDIYNKALNKAKAARAQSDFGIKETILFENDRYSVTIEARAIGKDDGGGRQYEGVLQVQNRDNGDLLVEQQVWGHCGC